MKTLYLDCFAGISGDMFLGAMIDLGVPAATLAEKLSLGLGLDNFRLTAAKVLKNGIGGTKVTVEIQKEHRHRHLPEIKQMLENSSLPQQARQASLQVFHALAAAEGKIHNISPERVHFHEVGALDAIIDIVGAAVSLVILGVEQVICSPLPLGTGFVQCAHGTLPLPAPATLELLTGVPTMACDILGETVTPTGAALVKTLSAAFGAMPAMEISSVGYGAGQAERKIPNLVRAVLGRSVPAPGMTAGPEGLEKDCLTVVEANIDDMNPEFYEHITSQLFSAGAVDVLITPVIMKKGRPGQVVTCLAGEENASAVINCLLTETTSLGVRTYPCRRYKLHRKTSVVETPYGPVTVKLGIHPSSGQAVNIAPEWEDCKSLAIQHKIPVKIVYDLAKTVALQNNARWCTSQQGCKQIPCRTTAPAENENSQEDHKDPAEG